MQGAVQFLGRAWRNDLAGIVSSAGRSLLIAAPYIKYDEAAWLCALLHPGIEVVTLANIDAEAVSASALDLTALRRLAEASPRAKLIALSNLHAKVFVADENAAIVKSGNLTRSGLDGNFEYGVLLRKTGLVRTVRKDILSFTRLGSRVDANTIAELAPLEAELRQARVAAEARTPCSARRFGFCWRPVRKPQRQCNRMSDGSCRFSATTASISLLGANVTAKHGSAGFATRNCTSSAKAS